MAKNAWRILSFDDRKDTEAELIQITKNILACGTDSGLLPFLQFSPLVK